MFDCKSGRKKEEAREKERERERGREGIIEEEKGLNGFTRRGY